MNTFARITESFTILLLWDFELKLCFRNRCSRINCSVPGAGAWIIWSNILSPTYSRSMFWMHTAPGTYLLYASSSIYAPGALCIQNMLLEHICYMLLKHIWLIFSWLFMLYAPRAAGPGESCSWRKLFVEHNLWPKSRRSHNICLFSADQCVIWRECFVYTFINIW